jgi:hypothetical protein
MFVVRECRQVREVRRVIVAEDESVVRTLVVIGIHVTLNAMLNIDELSKMQEGAVQEVDTASDEAYVGATLVIGHAGGMDSVGTGDERSYLPKVVFDQ